MFIFVFYVTILSHAFLLLFELFILIAGLSFDFSGRNRSHGYQVMPITWRLKTIGSISIYTYNIHIYIYVCVCVCVCVN